MFAIYVTWLKIFQKNAHETIENMDFGDSLIYNMLIYEKTREDHAQHLKAVGKETLNETQIITKLE